MSTKTNNISLVINTKNEEKNIKDCINSAINIVNEIIVADMNSTDQTKKIAKSLGAKVYNVKDYGYVEPARNFALSKATNEWVLVLDADERLPKSLCDKITEIVSENKYDLVEIPFKNIIFNKHIKQSGWWPDNHIRVFKKTCVKWQDTIHTLPIYKGKKVTLPSDEKYAIIHNNYLSIDEFLTKLIRYTNTTKNIIVDTKNPKTDIISYYESEFFRRYLDLEGYKDNTHGLILSKLMEFYKFVELAKVLEINNFPKINEDDFYKIFKSRSSNSANPASLELEKKYREAKADLDKIQSAKFYKLWQNYNKLKKVLIRN